MGASALAEGDTVFGGPFWSMLGWSPAGLELTASLTARREHITLGPFTEPDRIAVFDVEPERLSIKPPTERSSSGATIRAHRSLRSISEPPRGIRSRWRTSSVPRSGTT